MIQKKEYYLSEIQRLLKRDLTDDEIRALNTTLDKIIRPPSPKIVDLNIPFRLIKRFYLQIYFGEDKRTKSRNKRDALEKKRLDEYKERNAEYYFMLMPQEIRNNFDFEQRRWIQDVLQRSIMIPTKKILEKNIRFKLKKRYYLTIYLGFDRRKGRRPSKDGLMNKLSFAGSAMIYAIVILFVVFFAKTVLNYDVFQGGHGIDVLLEKSGLLK
ncbi:MAG: hypothetical protein K9N06_05620 [Candidatus Cloacimonetes bacterium]|nr:hypothetical protein [Candidatus Cloacimonadota bacterium]